MLKALMLASPATEAFSPLRVRPEPVTPVQSMADAPAPDSVFSWTEPFVTEPLVPGPASEPASDSPSRPNQNLLLDGSESAANLIEAEVTLIPKAEVPSVSDWPLPESTVMLPVSSVAFVSAGLVVLTTLLANDRLAEPLITLPMSSDVRSPDTWLASLLCRSRPVTLNVPQSKTVAGAGPQKSWYWKLTPPTEASASVPAASDPLTHLPSPAVQSFPPWFRRATTRLEVTSGEMLRPKLDVPTVTTALVTVSVSSVAGLPSTVGELCANTKLAEPLSTPPMLSGLRSPVIWLAASLCRSRPVTPSVDQSNTVLGA